MIDWDSILYGRCEGIHRSLAVLSMCISHLWSHCCITDPPKKLSMYLICECLPFVFSIEKSICGNVRHYLWIFTSQCHRVHAGPFYECLQFVQNIKSCAHVSCCAKGFPWLVTCYWNELTTAGCVKPLQRRSDCCWVWKLKKKKVYLEMKKKKKTAWFCTIKMHTTALFPFEYFSPVS